MKQVMLILVVVFFVFGCTQNAKKPGSESTNTQPSAQVTNMPLEHVSKEQINAVFDSVVVTILDKVNKKEIDVTVPLNGEMKVEGTPLTVKIVEFYPDFVVAESVMTTRSLELNNPAVKIQITGTDPEYNGWQFEKFPDIHPYEHPNYGVIMKGVNKK